MKEGHRAQGAPLTVLNNLNCSDKDTHPRHQQGMAGELGKARLGQDW